MTGLHGLGDEDWEREMRMGGLPGYLERKERRESEKRARETELKRQAKLLGGLLVWLKEEAFYGFEIKFTLADSSRDFYWPDHWDVTIDGHLGTSTVSLADAVNKALTEKKKAKG